MNTFNNLMATLESKEYKVTGNFEDSSEDIKWIRFIVPSYEIEGWDDLIRRLNVVYERLYKIEVTPYIDDKMYIAIKFLTRLLDKNELDKSLLILEDAIRMEEYKFKKKHGFKASLDFKLGISCNNNCVHCVIKKKVKEMQKKYPENIVLDSGYGMMSSRDMSYDDIIESLSNQLDYFDRIVITGGEPTIRLDFIKIIKWLYYKKTNISIVIQTNGRNFSDINLVKQLRRYTREVHIVVAVHGMEYTHNKIVNNRLEKGNPFNETIQGIKNLLQVFGNGNVLTITVLTELNIKEMIQCVKFQHEQLKVKRITLTYPDFPHLEEHEFKELVPSTKDVSDLMKDINNYAKDKNNLKIDFAEIPLCFFSQLGDSINVGVQGLVRQTVAINFAGEQNNEYEKYLQTRFSKVSQCAQCLLNNCCRGVYKETVSYREQFIKPVCEITPSFKNLLVNIGLSK